MVGLLSGPFRRSDFGSLFCHELAMGTLRHQVKRGPLGTALAVLLAYLLLFQALASAMAGGAMAAAAATDPAAIVCSPDGKAAFDPSQDHPDHGKGGADCPCGLLCRLAATAMPAILGDGNIIVLRGAFARSADLQPVLPVLAPLRHGQIAEPRAPPLFS
jgi:hypothetical protein